jgi:7-carboxy-7-deazaguanine synthase
VKVIEVFGPTIQGEGPHAGAVTHFLRLGGCDYRCSWCDSMHAVEPASVRAAEDLNPIEVAARLGELAPAPMLVISGGNPVLWDLEDLLPHLWNYRCLAVETQGSIWRPWLRSIHSLVISPKPPSSGMVTERHHDQFMAFMARARQHAGAVLKVVVFDEDDLTFAREIASIFPRLPFYLSCGTDPDDDRDALGDRYAWLCERVVHEPDLSRYARVLPQLHVVAWGHRVGV